MEPGTRTGELWLAVFRGEEQAWTSITILTPGSPGSAFNPAAPVATIHRITQACANRPTAQPAWLWYPYDASPEFPELDGSGGRTAMGGPVYHYKTNVVNGKKLPAYYEGSLFIWEWSRNYLKEVKMDESGNVLKISPFLPSFTFNRPIDLKVGPDGCIYVIEWGTAIAAATRMRV